MLTVMLSYSYLCTLLKLSNIVSAGFFQADMALNDNGELLERLIIPTSNVCGTSCQRKIHRNRYLHGIFPLL